MHVCAHGGQRRARDPSELESKMGVSPHVGTENGTQISALNSPAISPACFAFKLQKSYMPIGKFRTHRDTKLQGREISSQPCSTPVNLAHSFPESSSGVPLSNRSKMKLSVQLYIFVPNPILRKCLNFQCPTRN